MKRTKQLILIGNLIGTIFGLTAELITDGKLNKQEYNMINTDLIKAKEIINDVKSKNITLNTMMIQFKLIHYELLLISLDIKL